MIGSTLLSTLCLSLLADPQPWISRVQPANDTWELGGYGGVSILSDDHDLYDVDTAPQRRLRRAGPLGGLRGGYFPLSFVGAEAEFDGLWTERADGSEPVFAWGLRGHAVLQLPFYRVVPFVFGGYGVMGARSSRDAVGNDVDPAGHYGLGAKLLITPWLAVRVDGRHMMSAAAARRRAVAHHGSVTLGLSFTLGRARASQSEPRERPPAPNLALDTDRDGITDTRDACPTEPGAGADGCVPTDGDGDGIMDLHDRCPDDPGVSIEGCPVVDTDADGIVDAHDRCPDQPGVGTDGCSPPPPEPVPAPQDETTQVPMPSPAGDGS
ncbi:MAG: thrombospondin type 3 repeat-containing protein [Deltaproteobacteria bacterium]|nr:thrombospondin type 3 repeat-containing protein [Deltaproteobacteria bacterium]